MSFLAEFFGEQICRWPLRSPDLSTLHLFLLSYVKNIVYKDARRSIAERKKKIEDAVRELNTSICRTVFANLILLVL